MVPPEEVGYTTDMPWGQTTTEESDEPETTTEPEMTDDPVTEETTAATEATTAEAALPCDECSPLDVPDYSSVPFWGVEAMDLDPVDGCQRVMVRCFTPPPWDCIDMSLYADQTNDETPVIAFGSDGTAEAVLTCGTDGFWTSGDTMQIRGIACGNVNCK